MATLSADDVKRAAREMGADLVGIGSMDRFVATFFLNASTSWPNCSHAISRHDSLSTFRNCVSPNACLTA